MTQAWDQQVNEGPAAYQAFRVFLNLGMERRLGEAAIALNREPGIIHRLASDFQWIKRARAYDRWMVQTEEAAVKKSLEKSAVTWAQRRSQFREKEWTFAGDLFQLAQKLLTHFTSMPLTREVVESDTLSEDGTQRHTTIIIEPNPKVSIKDLAIISKTMSELARLSSGMETERKILGVVGFMGTDAERLQKARETYDRLKDQYRDRPHFLSFLPAWVAEDWDVDAQLLLEGEPPPAIDTIPETDSEN